MERLCLEENTLKLPQHILVQNSKGELKNYVAKILGYYFRVDSLFPGSWGGEFTVYPPYWAQYGGYPTMWTTGGKHV